MNQQQYPVFKYRSLLGEGKEWVLETIGNNVIYFSSPLAMNDPLDCRPVYSFDGDSAEYLKFADGVLHRKAGEYDPSEREKLLKTFLQPDMRQRLLENAVHSHEEKVMKPLGIYSVSEEGNHALMWSHYADSHRGICLQFAANPYDKNNFFFGRAISVHYQEERPVLNFIRQTPHEMLKAALLTKSKDWAYERERRLVDHEKGPGPQSFPPEDLEAVILGCSISDGDAAEISKAAKSRKSSTKILQARRSDTHYRMEYVAI